MGIRAVYNSSQGTNTAHQGCGYALQFSCFTCFMASRIIIVTGLVHLLHMFHGQQDHNCPRIAGPRQGYLQSPVTFGVL